MTDIVERLRDDQPGERQCVREARMDLGGLLMEAADEIEKLRAALIEINDLNSKRIGYSKKIERVIWEALGEKE